MAPDDEHVVIKDLVRDQVVYPLVRTGLLGARVQTALSGS